MASEAFAFREIAALQRDPIYRGEGVPRGDGRLVVIIPGLFGSDFYLWPLRRWISRIGFRASTSGSRQTSRNGSNARSRSTIDLSC